MPILYAFTSAVGMILGIVAGLPWWALWIPGLFAPVLTACWVVIRGE